MSILTHYAPLAALLATAGTFGVSVEAWMRRQDLRALNRQYEVLCAQMTDVRSRR
jgi:hypothetical protein